MRSISLKIDEKPTAIMACSLTRALGRGVVMGCLTLLVSPALFAAESAGDCTRIDLRYETLDAPLTDAEIAERRARRHDASLNAFERCITAAAGTGAGGSQGSGQGQGQGQGVAAQGIAGSDPIAAAPPPPSQSEQFETSEPAQVPDATLTNGRAPLDIPAADNDSVLAAQIRRAAESETDPERQARLWSEYRKIRGLPIPKTDT